METQSAKDVAAAAQTEMFEAPKPAKPAVKPKKNGKHAVGKRDKPKATAGKPKAKAGKPKAKAGKSSKPGKPKTKTGKPGKPGKAGQRAPRGWDYDFDESEVIGSFARNLAELRLAKGLTQEQLSEAIGYSRVAVCNMERGVNGATLATLLRIASVLRCSANDLLRKRTLK